MSLHSLAIQLGVTRHDNSFGVECGRLQHACSNRPVLFPLAYRGIDHDNLSFGFSYGVAVYCGPVSGVRAVCAMMQRNQYDACVTCPGSLAAISQHGYNYSMAIGDAWRVQVRVFSDCDRYAGDGMPIINTLSGLRKVRPWRGGSTYNYGIGKANYPVPAIPLQLVIVDEYRKPARLAMLRRY